AGRRVTLAALHGKRPGRTHQRGAQRVKRKDFELGHVEDLARRCIADDDIVRASRVVDGIDAPAPARHALAPLDAQTQKEGLDNDGDDEQDTPHPGGVTRRQQHTYSDSLFRPSRMAAGSMSAIASMISRVKRRNEWRSSRSVGGWTGAPTLAVTAMRCFRLR